MLAFLLVVSVVLLVVNGVFVMVEFSLVRVRASRMELLARRGSSRAQLVQEILGQMDVYLAAIQMGITVVSLAIGWLGEPALAELLSRGFARVPIYLSQEVLHALSLGAALVLLTFAHIVFSELIPRSVGIQRAEPIMLWGGYPLKAFMVFFRVPVHLMSRVAVAALRLSGLKSVAETETVVSEEEMRVLFGETQEKGALPLERLFLLENLFDLGATRVGDVMMAWPQVATLSAAGPWEENLAVIQSRRFSRYPLCGKDPHDVLGIVHVKDFLLREGGLPPGDLKALAREPCWVGEEEPLERLLKLFPDKGIHMALVRGNAGKPAGLLTLEDIFEELVGEVHDEFDLPKAWSFLDVLVPAAVDIQAAPAERPDAIRHLIGRLKDAHPALDAEEAFRLVLEREKKLSSAIGKGVAVPHARLANLARPLVALGRWPRVDFAGPDGAPVRLVFLILTPSQSPIIQLKILSRIASLASHENLRRKVLRAKTGEQIVDTLRTADTLLSV